MGAGTKTMDRSDTRHNKTASFGRKYWRRFIQLTEEELQEIESASAQIKIMGTRYTEAMEKTTGL